ncbi:MAG: DUF692 family protein [Aggregatilineales bacterium]
MTQLAINYSSQAARLLMDREISVDLFKVLSNPDLIEIAHQDADVYVHLPLRAGQGNLEMVDWAFIDEMLHKTNTPFVNLYLAPHAPDFPELELDSNDPVWRGRLIERMIRDVMLVKEQFGADRVILENAPWDVTPGYAVPRAAIEPEVIRQVVHETGCGLLLDLAHARMSALYLGMDVEDYIHRLPVQSLRELHLCGVKYDPNIDAWRDHFEMSADDWRLAEWAFSQVHQGKWATPAIVALEYGGVTPRLEWRSEPSIIRNDLCRLSKLMHRQIPMPQKMLA